MKPHSRGPTSATSPTLNNNTFHQHTHHLSKYQFTSNSWKELKYFQIFNLHQDETFQSLMTTYYNVIVTSVSLEDSRNNKMSTSELVLDSLTSTNNLTEESVISEKINSFIDSKYDLRIFANSLVSYEEVKEAYLNLSDPIKRKYYWVRGLPLNENNSHHHHTTTTTISNSILSLPSEHHKIVNNISNDNSSSLNTNNLGNNIQSPLSLFSLLNGNNSSSTVSNSTNTVITSGGKSIVFPYLNNSGPEQCTQPTVDQVIIPKNGIKSNIQLLLSWKCNSNVQEYCLMMKSPTKPEPHVIYRGHNNYFTTPALELGVYNFKVRATNRFGVGEFSKELEYHIKVNNKENNNNNNHHSNNNVNLDQNNITNNLDSNNNNNTNNNSNNQNNSNNTSNNKKSNTSIQNKSIEELKIKQRDDILNEINQYLNQNCKPIVQNSVSINQCDEILSQLLSYQSKYSKFSTLPIASPNHDEIITKLESMIVTVRQLLSTFKVIREWRITLKNSLSEFIHNTSSNDNEQLSKIRNLITSFSKDIPEPIKLMIFQTIIQFTKKKLTESPTIRSRAGLLLSIFSSNLEFFGEACSNEMDDLSKQLLESKKKKKPTSQVVQQQNHNNIAKKPKTHQQPTLSSPKTPKLQINTTPQITMSQLLQQQEQQKQENLKEQNENVVNSQQQQTNLQLESLNISNNSQNINGYHIDNFNNSVKYPKSSNIPIQGTSIKSSADEIIHDFKVPSSPPIGSNLIVSPPKSVINHHGNINDFYPIPFQGFLTPVLSNLHQNVNLSKQNNPNSPTPFNNDGNHQKEHSFNSYNFQSNQSLFFNQPFKNNQNINSQDNTYTSQDDFFRQLMDNNHSLITTTTTTTTTTFGKQSPPPILPTNPFQYPSQQKSLIPTPAQDTSSTSSTFSFFQIVPNS